MNNKDHLQLARDLIIKRDLEWAQAHRDLDLKLIEDILSEGYQQIQDDGSSIGKSELLASYGSGNRQWNIAESSDHQVQFSGDLAILIGRWRGKGSTPERNLIIRPGLSQFTASRMVAGR